jgi:hypothetical protein
MPLVSIAFTESQLRAVEMRARELGASVGGFLRDTALRAHRLEHMITEPRGAGQRRGRVASPLKGTIRRAGVPLSPAQRDALGQRARDAGVTLSELIRAAANVQGAQWGGARKRPAPYFDDDSANGVEYAPNDVERAPSAPEPSASGAEHSASDVERAPGAPEHGASDEPL